MTVHVPTVLLSLIFLSWNLSSTVAEETAADSDNATESTLPEGHSAHGEVFNEGPRQAAYLMDGVGNVRFPVTAASDEARAFVVQGVAQLHGFWYFESERSFRQAAALDPECAIAYWGMAMSNRRNSERAIGFIKEASDRKEKTSRREKLYIEAFSRYINAKNGTTAEKTKRAEKYVSDLEDLVFEFPEDIEARAFLCEFLWSARKEGIKTVSYLTIDALIQDVLDVEPLHPVHHYRIHLWDTKKAEMALESAARCGLSAPAIAHMWHMPGHIYSRLKRYEDAVYQQEASARVDHAHMMKDLVLPDQIHNFAHNNEWCIRNLVHIGRVHDAVNLAKNMIELPRHPAYNHIGKSGSYKYGRQRLLNVLRTYEMFEEIIALSKTPYLDECGDDREDRSRLRAIGVACAKVGRKDDADTITSELNKLLESERAAQKTAGDKAEEAAKQEKKSDADIRKARSAAEGKSNSTIRELEKSVREIEGHLAVHEKRYTDALDLFKKSGGVPVEEQVAVMLLDGQNDEAAKKISDHIRTNRNEVRPLAAQVETLWQVGKKDEAKQALDALHQLSAVLDLDVPAFARITPIAVELGFPENWKQTAKLADDLGARPDLDSLGPFRWRPVRAPDWQLTDVNGVSRSMAEFRGRPVVVIFYLGSGCLHCAEQLQKFAPKIGEFHAAGLEVIAVSTDKQQDLDQAFKDYAAEEIFPIPLVADPELTAFTEYRCFDDFEKQTLHGTFIIDADGYIRWQDISYEPFMDPDFVIQEAQRLLQFSSASSSTDS